MYYVDLFPNKDIKLKIKNPSLTEHGKYVITNGEQNI